MMVSRLQVSSDDIAGPVRIVTMIDSTVERRGPMGWLTVLLELVNLSVMFSANLGVMNLLPLPALDGGRLCSFPRGFFAESRWISEIEGTVHLTGMALLMAFMVFVIFNDFRNI